VMLPLRGRVVLRQLDAVVFAAIDYTDMFAVGSYDFHFVPYLVAVDHDASILKVVLLVGSRITARSGFFGARGRPALHLRC
jgi:hypothetical protein